MKRNNFPAFIAIIFIFLFIGSKPIFAQESNNRFLEIEISKKEEFFSQKAKIPFTEKTFDDNGKNLVEGEFYFGGFATVDCINCNLSSEYDIFSYAKHLNENSSEIYISVNFRNKRKCSIKDRKFVIQRGNREEFNLKCGVKLNAYYE